MNKERAAAIAAKKKTLESFRVLDENICLLDYHADYGLPVILASGKKSIFSLARLFQRQIHAPGSMSKHMRCKGGCSTFNARTPEGQIIMGRNFDYKLSKCLVVWTHPENGYKSMAVVNQNHLLHKDLARTRRRLRAMAAPYTSMDGVNEKGLAIAILMLITKPTKQNNGKPPITVVAAVRGILDTCATVEEAIAFLDKYAMHDLLGSCYHYQITDAQGNSAIVEYVDGQMHVIRQKEKEESLKLTNFFLTPGGKSREKGRDRFEKMGCALQEKPVMTEREAMGLLESVKVYFQSKYKIYYIGTLWSAVYNCTNRTMLLSANGDYSRVYRLSVDEPLKAVRIKTEL